MWLQIHWEYFISRNLVPRSVKKTKNLWRESIAFLKLEVVVDTSWIINKIVNNLAVETGFCVKVRKSHVNIIKERPDLGVKRMHPRSSNLLLFFSWILLWTLMVYLPWLRLWAVLMEVFSAFSWEVTLSFSSSISLSVLCAMFYLGPATFLSASYPVSFTRGCSSCYVWNELQ